MHVFSNVGGRTDREQNKSFDARRRRIIIDRPRGRREFSPARDGGEVMQTGKNTKIHTHYTTYSPSTIETMKNIVINRTVTAQARWTEPSGSTSQLANNLPRTGMPPPPRPILEQQSEFITMPISWPLGIDKRLMRRQQCGNAHRGPASHALLENVSEDANA